MHTSVGLKPFLLNGKSLKASTAIVGAIFCVSFFYILMNDWFSLKTSYPLSSMNYDLNRLLLICSLYVVKGWSNI